MYVIFFRENYTIKKIFTRFNEEKEIHQNLNRMTVEVFSRLYFLCWQYAMILC